MCSSHQVYPIYVVLFKIRRKRQYIICVAIDKCVANVKVFVCRKRPTSPVDETTDNVSLSKCVVIDGCVVQDF
jgi:hypothetical protein